MKYLIGIDGGGTRSRLLACSVNGKLLGRQIGKSTNIESNSRQVVKKHLEELIEGYCRKYQKSLTDCISLCLGTAGVDTQESLQVVKEIVNELNLPCPVHVVNDAEIALAAQTAGKPGVILISGTGSIGFAVNDSGKQCRVGGYGYLIGDEGSAYWLAKKAISALLRAYDGTGEETLLFESICQYLGMSQIDEIVDFVYRSNKAEIAKLAPQVVNAFDRGDMVAKQIMEEAADHLAKMAIALGRRLHLESLSCPLVFAGGIFLNIPWMKETVAQRVLCEFPLWKPMCIHHDAEYGAVYLAAKHIGFCLDTILQP